MGDTKDSLVAPYSTPVLESCRAGRVKAAVQNECKTTPHLLDRCRSACQRQLREQRGPCGCCTHIRHVQHSPRQLNSTTAAAAATTNTTIH